MDCLKKNEHMQILYFDYAASTPIDKRVAEKMRECLTNQHLYANPSSRHMLGNKAKEVIEMAREQVAACIHAHAEDLIFTSGATESNNMAIKGAARLYQRKGKHIITMRSEHKSVVDACQHLEKEGYQITYLKPLANGLLNIDEFINAIRDDTILVSIMHVNNETGVIQDLNRLAEITSSRNILLHVDAAQSAGKLAINVQETPIDLLSLCAHKLYGPKGIGALYLRKKPRVRVEPLIHGGGHEKGMRSGTLATHQIVGMGEAFHIAKEVIEDESKAIVSMRDHFLKKLNQDIEEKKIIINTDTKHSVPHILNLRFPGKIAAAILANIPHVAASTASACQGDGTEGSYVLRAMGLNTEDIQSSLRLSFGRFTTRNEIDALVIALKKTD